MVEQIAPMMPASFAARAADDLIFNKQYILFTSEKTIGRRPCTKTTKQKVVPCQLSAAAVSFRD